MKKLVMLLLFVPLVSFGQEFKYQNNIMSVVFEVDSTSASEIHSRALSAIANMYNSANNVIQLNDKESNKLVIKSKSSIVIDNPVKLMYPKNKYITSGWEIFFSNTINIDSKDNRYRIVYSVSNPEYDAGTYGRMPFDGERFFIFEPSEKTKIDEYIDEQLNKSGMGIIGKKKKALYATALEKMPENIVLKLKENAKSISLFVNDAIQQKSALESNSILNDDF